MYSNLGAAAGHKLSINNQAETLGRMRTDFIYPEIGDRRQRHGRTGSLVDADKQVEYKRLKK